jgi:hypothetical protein
LIETTCGAFALTRSDRTSTASTTVTVTALPVTATTTSSTLISQTVTQTDLQTSTVATISDAITTTAFAQAAVTITSTTTVTQSVAPGNAKRAVVVELLPSPSLLSNTTSQALAAERRAAPAASTCAVSSATPTDTPGYAGVCPGTARYSSACSRIGVIPMSTTLTASTTTVTSTSTVTYTPTAVVTSVESDTATATATVASIVSVTLETTYTTVTLTSTSTSTQQAAATSTVTVKYCNSYTFIASSGTFQGQFLGGSTPPSDRISYGNPMLRYSASNALTCVMQSDGTLFANNVYELAGTGNYNYVYQLTTASLRSYSTLSPLYCSIGGSSPVPQAVGTLSCTYKGQNIILETCSRAQVTVDRTNYLLTNTNVDNGCTQVNLAAIFAGQVPC